MQNETTISTEEAFFAFLTEADREIDYVVGSDGRIIVAFTSLNLASNELAWGDE